MKLIHLKHHDIDKLAWDATVGEALVRLPYAFSWFLDVVSPQWEALVTPDYTYVMPLPVKRKFGIAYVIQPRWTQQLGIFSKEHLTSDIIDEFLRHIPYLSYDFNLHYGHLGTFKSLPNRIIDLSASYSVIQQAFSKNTKRNISKAEQAGLQVATIESSVLVDFWRSQNGDKPLELGHKLPLLCEAAQQHQMGVCYGVFTANHELVATLMTLETDARIIYLVPTSNRLGKELCAMFLLVDYLLKTNAGTAKVFDCEGSQIPGVSRFYEGFGAVLQPYFTVNRCRPQWLVKLLHR